jgi:mannosyltransferase OCH1-like enzyme
LAHSTPFLDARPQHIPKIIHQVYHDWRNRSMPLDWDEVRQTCISVNPGWEYKVPTDLPTSLPTTPYSQKCPLM